MNDEVLLGTNGADADFDEEETLFKEYRVVADKGQSPLRVDKFLVEHIAHISRNKIQQVADAGSLTVNGKPAKCNYKVKPCDVVVVTMDTPAYDNSIVPEDIPLDIVYEDADLMVVNKPAGLVVHPGCGNTHGTLINAVAWHMRDDSNFDPNDPQVGLVHRIDKNTSGLLGGIQFHMP